MPRPDTATLDKLLLYPEIADLVKNGVLKADGPYLIPTNPKLSEVKLFKLNRDSEFISALDSDGNYKDYYPQDRQTRFPYLFNFKPSEGEKPAYVFIENRFTSTASYGHTDFTIASHENGKYQLSEVGFEPKKTYTASMAETLVIPLPARIIGGWSTAPHTDGKNDTALGIKLPNASCAFHLKYDTLIDALTLETKDPKYRYLATSIGNSINCTTYSLRKLKNVGVDVKKLIDHSGRIFAPGQLGTAIHKFANHPSENNNIDNVTMLHLKNRDNETICGKLILYKNFDNNDPDKFIYMNLKDLRRNSGSISDRNIHYYNKSGLVDLKMVLNHLFNEPPQKVNMHMDITLGSKGIDQQFLHEDINDARKFVFKMGDIKLTPDQFSQKSQGRY